MAQDKKRESINLIGEGTIIEGKIIVPTSINISGVVTGRIEAGDTVIINKNGEVKGDIVAKSAEIWGKITGDITCSNRIELGENALFIGNITTKELVIQRGAIFHGQSSMTAEEAKKVVAAEPK